MAIEKLQEAVATPEVGLFVVLGQYPLGFILSLVALVSLCAFFVTSANSGVYVLSMLSTDGAINPPNGRKILWGSYPVSYGDRTSDGWWIETASDNLTCSSVLIYFCNAWNDCSIY